MFSEPDCIAQLSEFSDHAEYLSNWVENRVNWLNDYFNSSNFSNGIFLNEDNVPITEDVNIAEYTTKFMMFASHYAIDDTPSFKVDFNANSWWNTFQCCMTGVMLEKDTEYILSFDYSSTSNMSVDYAIQQNYDSYSAYERGTVNSTFEVQHFETSFTSSVQDANCTLAIQGNGSANSSVIISNICLKKVSNNDKLLGDINIDGTISTIDLLYLKRHILGISSLIDNNIINADINEDNLINVIDVILLKTLILNN